MYDKTYFIQIERNSSVALSSDVMLLIVCYLYLLFEMCRAYTDCELLYNDQYFITCK